MGEELTLIQVFILKTLRDKGACTLIRISTELDQHLQKMTPLSKIELDLSFLKLQNLIVVGDLGRSTIYSITEKGLEFI